MKHIWYRLLAFSLTVVLLSVLTLLQLTFSTPALAANEAPTTDFFRQGVQSTQSSRYTEAVEAFTQAIQAKSDLAAAYANRCLVEIELARYAAAIADCTHAIQQTPENLEAYLNRGLAAYRAGNYSAAITDNNYLIQRQPHDLRAYVNRGLAQVRLGQYQAAIADFNQALAQPSSADAATIAEIYIDRGLASFALSEVPGANNFVARSAIADFNQAIQLDGNNDRAYYNRGCIYGKQGNYAAAIQDFTQALQLNPDNSEAQLDRGVAQYNLSNDQAALDDLQKAAKGFQSQGKTIAYQRALELIKQVQQVQEPVLT